MANGGSGGIRRPAGLGALCALLGLLVRAPGAAQQVSVSATVLPPAPISTGVTDLRFGAITPAPERSVLVEVTPGDAGVRQAAEFAVDISGAVGVSFGLVLPAALTSAQGHSLAVDFDDARYGAHCIRQPEGGCERIPFIPSGTALQVCREPRATGSCPVASPFPRGSILSVFVGGALTVKPAQSPGDYSGTITLTIAPWE